MDRAFGFDHEGGQFGYFRKFEREKVSVFRHRGTALLICRQFANGDLRCRRSEFGYWLKWSLDWNWRRWGRSCGSILDRCKEARDFALRISEPIGAPDPVQSPPKPNENLVS